jgi:hypothetical protein
MRLIKSRSFNPKADRNQENEHSAHPERVDLGAEQGLSDFETGGILRLFRGFQMSENAALGPNMPFLDGH